MATLKRRLYRKNSSGTYDTVYLETDASIITGTLPVSHGGTGRTTLTSGYFLRGNGTSAVTMSSIDQVKEALGITSLPSGIIAMWSGTASNIPTGWLLCDGSNGTPDLRDRFIVGAGSTYSPKATGGEATHKLTTAEMPNHNHNLSLSGLIASSAGSHTHSVSGSFARIKSSQQYNAERGLSYTTYAVDNGGSGFIENSGAHTHSISGSGSISSIGSDVAHNNLPPYYALCFIMKE